jgi:hypothetical protein
VEWVHALAFLFDILCNRVGQQFVDDFLQIRARDFALDDFHHPFANGFDLRVLGIASFAMRNWVLRREPNAEHTQQVAIGCLDIDMAIDQCLPFLDHRAVDKIISIQVLNETKEKN